MAGLEFHQHVDVTVGAEIVPKDGAKQRQARNVIALGSDSPEISRHAEADAYAAAHGLYALTNIAGLSTAPEAGGAAIVALLRRLIDVSSLDAA